MKPKTILILGIAVAICAIAFIKLASGPAPLAGSAPGADTPPGSLQNAERPARPSLGPSRNRSIATPESRSADADALARLQSEIRQALESTNLETREFAFTDLIPALVLKDPAAAARLAEEVTDAEVREKALGAVARLWTAQDAAATLAWAGALTNAEDRETTLTYVCLEMARSNPAAAVRAREGLIGDRSDPALASLAQQWAEVEFSKALAWTLARQRGEQRDELIARLAFVQARTSPAEAAQLVVDQIPPGEAQEEAAISVLHQWALTDLAAAGSWAERFPDSPLRERALRELAHITSRRENVN